jgi:cytochrome c oxidase subunit IV
MLWGCLLGASAALLWAFSFGLNHSPESCTSATCVAEPYLAPALLTAAGAGSFLVGLVLVVTGRGGTDAAARPIADQSMTTVVLAIGIGIATLGLAIGWWLVAIGAGLVALGVGGLIREQLALRRLRRSV